MRVVQLAAAEQQHKQVPEPQPTSSASATTRSLHTDDFIIDSLQPPRGPQNISIFAAITFKRKGNLRVKAFDVVKTASSSAAYFRGSPAVVARLSVLGNPHDTRSRKFEAWLVPENRPERAVRVPCSDIVAVIGSKLRDAQAKAQLKLALDQPEPGPVEIPAPSELGPAVAVKPEPRQQQQKRSPRHRKAKQRVLSPGHSESEAPKEQVASRGQKQARTRRPRRDSKGKAKEKGKGKGKDKASRKRASKGQGAGTPEHDDGPSKPKLTKARVSLDPAVDFLPEESANPCHGAPMAKAAFQSPERAPAVLSAPGQRLPQARALRSTLGFISFTLLCIVFRSILRCHLRLQFRSQHERKWLTGHLYNLLRPGSSCALVWRR